MEKSKVVFIKINIIFSNIYRFLVLEFNNVCIATGVITEKILYVIRAKIDHSTCCQIQPKPSFKKSRRVSEVLFCSSYIRNYTFGNYFCCF